TEAITQLKSNIDQLCSQKTAILNEVKDLRGKVEALFNSIESEIKEHVSVQHDGEVVVLKAQCDKYERIKAEISASEKTLSELPVVGNIALSLEKIAAVENEIKNQLSFIQSCHGSIKQIKLEFAIDNQLLSFLNTFSQIGTINANYFESNMQDPPELLSRGCTLNESFVPSRDVSMASEDLQPSSPPSRHVSPRPIFITRPPVTSIASGSNDAAATGASSQLETVTHSSRAPKEQKRPKTVPIESTAPTPVVRPRPERPDIRGTIPHFLPRSCSSPLGHSSLTVTAHPGPSLVQQHANSSEHESRDIEQQLDSPSDGSQPSVVSSSNASGFSNGNVISGKPPVTEKPKHKAWQYVNMISGTSEHDRSRPPRRNSETEEREEGGTSNSKSIFRTRSSSASNAPNKEDSAGATGTGANGNDAGQFASSVSAATASFNQIIRSFQSKSLPKSRENDTNHVYENSLIASCASTPTTERSFSFASLPNGSSSSKYNPKHCARMKDIGIRIESDVRECTVTGSVELADKRLILIDCNNSKVKLFDTDFNCSAHLDMAKEPWNVSAMSPNEIAVTVPLEKTIHVIRVATSSLSTLKCIVTRRECWGIAYVDRKFITTTKDDGNQVAFLDENGRELQVINFAARENPNILRPVSLSIADGGNTLYVCCEGQSGTRGALVRMSARGDILTVFTNKDLDRPYSAAIDANNENVYVAAIRSANVLMISEGGNSVTSVLSRDVGLLRPQHIHVTSWEDKTVIILTERRLDKAYVYCLK
ncbi:MAG: hypothetical protein OEY28_11680, partial [Nitrospira sp.]|nr:hypothetical protein [Nitrospira sp.]